MKKYLIFGILTMVMFSCGKQKNSNKETSDVAVAEIAASENSLIAKVIKTADMKFRVRDVQQTKEKLSAAIKAEGGTVSEFSIQSNVQRTEKVKYSADSLLELTSYRTDGLVIARIPSEKLDDFTNKITKLAVFIDQQSMKMDDQGIAYLSNKLKNENKADAVQQINKYASKKSNNAEKSLYIKDDYVDNKIENMSIDARVKYSTITLNFYQDNTVKSIVVGNDDLYSYHPNFFSRFALSFQNGWFIFKEFILVLTNLWVWILIAVAGYLAFRYRKKRRIAA